MTPAIRRWVYLATTFSDVAVPLLTYGSIFMGSCVLVGVFVNAYKSLVFTKETIEIGMRNIRRHSNIIVHQPNRLLHISDNYYRRDSYVLLNDVITDIAEEV